MVFVHGAEHDHSVWALQSRYFAHHGVSVLAIDLPGHCRSSGPALATIESMADWLIALLDAAGVTVATLIGHSMGALAVLECAARHPARVERLALLGPAVPMAVSDALLDAAREDEPMAHALINGWSFSAARQLGGNPVPGMWMTGSALRLMERIRPGVLIADLLACKHYDRGADAAALVRCPTLLLLAENDLMAPSRSAEVLIQRIAHQHVVTLPVCGHAMMAEQPDAVLDALKRFIAADAGGPLSSQSAEGSGKSSVRDSR